MGRWHRGVEVWGGTREGRDPTGDPRAINNLPLSTQETQTWDLSSISHRSNKQQVSYLPGVKYAIQSKLGRNMSSRPIKTERSVEVRHRGAAADLRTRRGRGRGRIKAEKGEDSRRFCIMIFKAYY